MPEVDQLPGRAHTKRHHWGSCPPLSPHCSQWETVSQSTSPPGRGVKQCADRRAGTPRLEGWTRHGGAKGHTPCSLYGGGEGRRERQTLPLGRSLGRGSEVEGRAARMIGARGEALASECERPRRRLEPWQQTATVSSLVTQRHLPFYHPVRMLADEQGNWYPGLAPGPLSLLWVGPSSNWGFQLS